MPTAIGDGAANIGAFHKSLNLASLWKTGRAIVVHEAVRRNRFGGFR
ncbi:thiamine pyrophosphate-dependent enzyme [Nocardia pseudovaccinii]|nr:thiamine pyrophosphate-dependent enzyme [Nocardia pseudovaccinii]